MKKSHANYRKACSAYCDAKASGKGNVESRKIAAKHSDDEGGVLNHAQAGLAWYADERNPKGIVPGSFTIAGMTDAEAAKTVGLLRAGLHPKAMDRKFSEGDIMILCGSNEPQGHGALTAGAVRRLFGAATGLAFEGTRIGRGGRFLQSEAGPIAYDGNRKSIGVEAPKPRSVSVKELQATKDTVTSKLPTVLKAKTTAARSRARKPKVAKTEG